MTINSQQASPDIRIPEIESIKSIEDVKHWLRQFRHEWENSHREQWRDTNNVYKVELPAVAAVELDFSIPLIEGVEWSVSGGVPEWTSGTVTYQGTTYEILSSADGPSTPNSSTVAIEWNSDTPTYFIARASPLADPNVWVMAFFDGSEVFPALQSTVIHGGVIQASTITSTQVVSRSIVGGDIASKTLTSAEIDVDNLFAQTIEIQPGGNIHQGKTSYASTSSGYWIGDDSGTPKFHIGDSNYYFKWDGSNTEIKTDTGFMGDSVDYFDISNGTIQLKDSAYSKYVYLKDGGMSIYQDADGEGAVLYQVKTFSSSPNTDIRQVLRAGTNSDHSTGSIASSRWERKDGTVIHEIGCNGGGQGFFRFVADNNNYIRMDDIAGVFELKGVAISLCTIDSTCTISSASSLPVVTTAKGGTGLTSSGSSGNVLTSNGSTWVSSPLDGSFSHTEIFNGSDVANKVISPTGATSILSFQSKVYTGTNRSGRSGINVGGTVYTWNSSSTVDAATTEASVSGGSLTLNMNTIGINNSGESYVIEVRYEK